MSALRVSKSASGNFRPAVAATRIVPAAAGAWGAAENSTVPPFKRARSTRAQADGDGERAEADRERRRSSARTDIPTARTASRVVMEAAYLGCSVDLRVGEIKPIASMYAVGRWRAKWCP